MRSNENILKLIRDSQSERAFAILYSGFPKVKKLILSKGGKKEDAEDVFQEALVIFYRKSIHKDFKLTASADTYLYSICRFLWKDIQRKQKRSNDFNNITLIQDDDLEEIIEKEKKLQAIEEVLDKISKKCQEIFESFYFKKLSMKDIAVRMRYSSERVAITQKYKCLEQAKAKI